MYGTTIHVDVGYCLTEPGAGFAFPVPHTVASTRTRPLGARAVQNCPAVNLLERQLIALPCPIALRMRLSTEGAKLGMTIDPKGTAAKPEWLRRFLWIEPQARWRDPRRPVLRLRLPWFLVTDEPCRATMTPPFLDRGPRRWPGVGVAGRWPARDWPAAIDWALEWDDPKGELVLRQGDPLAYVFFEFDHPDKRPRLVEAEPTAALADYRAGMDGVHHITDDIPDLWARAASRRPERLLVPVGEGA
ncbi:MAG: hypothetical protein ACFBWO_06720 [Paracoccaceae bacterium]